MIEAIEIKICPKCFSELPVTRTFFNLSSFTRDGLQSWCRQCKRISQQSDAGKIAHIHSSKKYRITLTGKEVHRKNSNKYSSLNPEKIAAHNAVNNAITSGKIIRPGGCGRCFRECIPEAHHENYTEKYWFEIYWLCAKCHRDWHSKLNMGEYPYE